MNRGKISIGRILLLPSFMLIGILVFIAGTVSYAKYVSGEESKQSAGIANMGVELFELVEYGKPVNELKIDYTKVVPGADIPGPHIRLMINSEVSWTLFVRVTQTGLPLKGVNEHDREIDTIYYEMSENWAQVPGQEGLYRYIVNDPKESEHDYVFKPATVHDYTGESEIAILAGDMIYVSQYYDKASEFTLSFEAYIRQTLE